MTQTETTALPGARCLICVAAKQINKLKGHVNNIEIDYMEVRFCIPEQTIIRHGEDNLVIVELEGTIIRETGRASFLVKYGDHQLRVPAQQLCLRSEIEEVRV